MVGITDASAASTPLRASMLLVSTYLFPLAGFPLVTYGWWRTSGSWPFVAMVMGLPVVFGYIMPGVATHYVKRWRFTSGPRVGSYYVHHGFVYGSKLAFVLLLAVRSPATVQSALDMISVVLVTGAATAFGGWWHDVNAVRAGKIEVDGGAEALTSFAPASYFAMGATYAGIILASYRVLIRDPGALPWIFVAGLLVLCVLPTIVFLAVDPPTRRVFHAWWMRNPIN